MDYLRECLKNQQSFEALTKIGDLLQECEDIMNDKDNKHHYGVRFKKMLKKVVRVKEFTEHQAYLLQKSSRSMAKLIK